MKLRKIETEDGRVFVKKTKKNAACRECVLDEEILCEAINEYGFCDDHCIWEEEQR